MRLYITVLAIFGLLLGALTPATAVAGQGSVISGTVWVDANGDGLPGPAELEPARAAVPVHLHSSPDGALIATTATDGQGVYRFADMPDGSYAVRADAPEGFRFSDAATGGNSFVRAPDAPERGTTAPVIVTEASAAAGLDAALQPVPEKPADDVTDQSGGENEVAPEQGDAEAAPDASDAAPNAAAPDATADDAPQISAAAAADEVALAMRKLARADACDGFATTGQPAFDEVDGPGQDSGPANCIVRLNDLVVQDYGVSLTGLPNGESVNNVVAEFVLTPTNGGRVAFAGPGAGGMPGECLTSANGANPTSRVTAPAADGSVTLICNIGTMASNVAGIQVTYRFLTNTPLPATVELSGHAYAAQGGAADSNAVTGPVVTATGAAEWELVKAAYGYATSPAPRTHDSSPGTASRATRCATGSTWKTSSQERERTCSGPSPSTM